MEPLPEKNIDSIFEDYDADDVRTPMNNASEASLPTLPLYKARTALFPNVTQCKPFTSHSDGDQVNKSNPFAIHNESNNATIFKSPTSRTEGPNVTTPQPFTSHGEGDQVNKSKPFSGHRESSNVNNSKSPLRL